MTDTGAPSYSVTSVGKNVKKLSQTKISSYFMGCTKTIASNNLSIKQQNRRKGCRRMSALKCTDKSVDKTVVYDSSSFGFPKKRLPAPIFSSDEESENDSPSPIKKQNIGKRSSAEKPTVLISLNRPSSSVNNSPSKASDWNPLLTSTPSHSELQERKFVFTESALHLAKYSHISSIVNSVIASTSSQNVDEIPSCSKTISSDTVKHRTEALNCTDSSKESNTIRVLENIVVQSPNKMPSLVNKEKCDVSRSPTKSPQKITPLDKEKRNVSSSPNKSPQKMVLEHKEKTEEKKVNYDNLRVMREFFINILKNNHLLNLLHKDDTNMLKFFFEMDRNYQYTCIKLFVWKRTWYNVFQYVQKIGLGLTMSENDVSRMYNYLEENGFIHTNFMTEETFTLLNLLSLKDVRDLIRSFKLGSPAGTKDVLISKLLKNAQSQSTLTFVKNTEDVLRERIKEKMGFSMKLSRNLNKCLYYIYLLNTFTNSDLIQPQEYFKNVNYFNIVFPPYKTENFHIFYTVEEFQKFTEAIQLRCDLEKAIEKKNDSHIFEICKCAFTILGNNNSETGNSFDNSREPHLERFTPNAQYVHILSVGSKHITSTHFNEVRVWFEYLISQGYCQYKRGEWYCHLSLIYTTYFKDYRKAATLIITALREEKDHFSDVQLHELAHRGNILNKKTYNLPPLYHDEIASLSPPSCDRNWPQDVLDCKSLRSEEPGRKRTYVHQCENGDVNYLTVEQTALKHYQTLGYPNGEHCEGSLILASFCLLFWDIIYDTYVRGTFVSSVQHAPLDMYTKFFYLNRKKIITKRLKDIRERWSEEKLKITLIHNWNQHSHETSLCQIDSVVDNCESLFTIIICIGRKVLSKIFERLVENYRVYHSGFPDLIVWNSQQKKAKFVEVKGENDKLSIKQKLWLNYLMDIEAHVEVCRVEPKASKKKFIKNVAKDKA